MNKMLKDIIYNQSYANKITRIIGVLLLIPVLSLFVLGIWDFFRFLYLIKFKPHLLPSQMQGYPENIISGAWESCYGGLLQAIAFLILAVVIIMKYIKADKNKEIKF